MNDLREDLILGSGRTFSNDEVFIQTDGESNLVRMSKKSEELESLDAELVGISKVSAERYALMNRHFQALMGEYPKADYEYLFVQTVKDKPLAVKKIDNLIWCEIDDAAHLKKAHVHILPQIGG